jgi:hypothetical protein
VTEGDKAEACALFDLFDPICDRENDPALQALAKLLQGAQ